MLVRGNQSGKLVDAGRRYRLTVKGARITSRAEKPQKNGITFVLPKALWDCLPEGLDPATFYPVRLTVMVRRDERTSWSPCSKVRWSSRSPGRLTTRRSGMSC